MSCSRWRQKFVLKQGACLTQVLSACQMSLVLAVQKVHFEFWRSFLLESEGAFPVLHLWESKQIVILVKKNTKNCAEKKSFKSKSCLMSYELCESKTMFFRGKSMPSKQPSLSIGLHMVLILKISLIPSTSNQNVFQMLDTVLSLI